MKHIHQFQQQKCCCIYIGFNLKSYEMPVITADNIRYAGASVTAAVFFKAEAFVKAFKIL